MSWRENSFYSEIGFPHPFEFFLFQVLREGEEDLDLLRLLRDEGGPVRGLHHAPGAAVLLLRLIPGIFFLKKAFEFPHPIIFCLRRSPDHGTVDVVVVLLLLLGGTTLIFDFFQDTEIFIK